MFEKSRHRHQVLVLDMQPIEPAIGGGRLRLLGLYHGLGTNVSTLYVGTYDWPGEKMREHRLSRSLVEVNIPLSEAHFEAVRELESKVGGKTIIDSTFPRFAHLSKNYVQRVRQEVLSAEIVVFSHPWIYPLVRDLLAPDRQLIVYDSQNVEGYLRAELLDDGDGSGAEIVKDVIRVEKDLCETAHLVLSCSQQDRLMFSSLYGTSLRKIIVLPNGAFTRKGPGPQLIDRKGGIALPDGPLAVFIGSSYPPNIEAATFLIDRVAPRLPDVTFAILGGVGESLRNDRGGDSVPSNVVITGPVAEEEKEAYYRAADLAVNPMFSGSGTNIKLLEFFAAPLPVVTTPIGARGIVQTAKPAMRIIEGDCFADEIRQLLNDKGELESLTKNARELVEKYYSWEVLSEELGRLITRWYSRLGRSQPFFSIVIPTYQRQERLTPLMKLLCKQTYKNFEVIIVDQSLEPWKERERESGELDVLYIHLAVPDVVHARNKGADLARGEILAFLDDDCEPQADWLRNAWCAFEARNIVGVEGLIKSSRLGDPDYRPVTNEGFPGIGFMTANLFIKRDVFNYINGFDYRFSPTPFREDSDLAWRALDCGEIPFVPEVVVYHPPHRRDRYRESLAARTALFAKDPLLEQKHPARYRQLFLVEDHWRHTSGFWENFFRGAKEYGVEVPAYYLWRFGQIARRELERQLGSGEAAGEGDVSGRADS